MIFDDMLTHVLPSVEGCPDPVALEHVKKAAREFCARTMCWNVEPDVMLTSPSVDTYPLDVDDEVELVKILGLVVDGSEWTVETPLRGRLMRYRNRGYSFGYIEDKADLVLYPTPTLDAREIFVQMAVKPSLLATEFPDELTEYVPDIAHGAIATLCRLPRKAWTDRQLSADELALFESRINSVALSVSRGNSNQPRRSRVRFI